MREPSLQPGGPRARSPGANSSTKELTVTPDPILVPETEPAAAEAPAPKPRPEYRPPEVHPIGRAADLVQSGSYGKYSDGYTGYYWER